MITYLWAPITAKDKTSNPPQKPQAQHQDGGLSRLHGALAAEWAQGRGCQTPGGLP